MRLHRYWITFVRPHGPRLGVGVTGYSRDDALAILRQKMFEGTVLPEVEKWEDDVDVRSLDQGHVIPNMMPPNQRGIWFPMGYV